MHLTEHSNNNIQVHHRSRRWGYTLAASILIVSFSSPQVRAFSLGSIGKIAGQVGGLAGQVGDIAGKAGWGDIGKIAGQVGGIAGQVGDYAGIVGGVLGSSDPFKSLIYALLGSSLNNSLIEYGLQALSVVFGESLGGAAGAAIGGALGELGFPDPIIARSRVEQSITGWEGIGAEAVGKCTIYSGFPGGTGTPAFTGGGPAVVAASSLASGLLGATSGSSISKCPTPGSGGTPSAGGSGSTPGGTKSPTTGGPTVPGAGSSDGAGPIKANPTDAFEPFKSIYSVQAGNEMDRQTTLLHVKGVIGQEGQAQTKAQLTQTAEIVKANTLTAEQAQKMDVTQDVMKAMTAMQARRDIMAAALQADTIRTTQTLQYSNLNLVNASRTLDELARSEQVNKTADAMRLMSVSGQTKLY